MFSLSCCILTCCHFFSLYRNPDTAEKHHRPGSCLVDINGHQDESDKAFSRPLLAASRSYFNFYINEEDQGKQKTDDGRAGKQSGLRPQHGTCNRSTGNDTSGMDEMEEDGEEAVGHQALAGLIEEGKTDRECAFLSHFNIPNFVNLDHNSTLGEDDLVYEPSVVLERQSHDANCYMH